jgi:hypothetical protein
MTNGSMDSISVQIQYKTGSYSRKKNIQADSLLQRPDLCPQGTDNEDVVVLPEHLFVNLINMKLQKKIANAKNMDYDAAEAIKELLEQGPRDEERFNGLGSRRIQGRKHTVLQGKELCCQGFI